MRMRRLIMAGLIAAVTASVAVPASAGDWGHRGWRGHEWRGHDWRERVWRERAWREHDWRMRMYGWRAPGWYGHYGYRAPPVVVTPRYGYYTAPRYYR